MILCYARFTASAVPFQGMGMTSHLSQVSAATRNCITGCEFCKWS
jgi:hypothetical protein